VRADSLSAASLAEDPSPSVFTRVKLFFFIIDALA
jgi:hypothetical protein